ncbi:ABC transporter ATP-binding protein [Legionella waltersii]|uniref:Multidrug resistance ABC transporter ATP-binding protein (Fused permease/ATPase domains) n=1 Tax=Legionella waltersii TaxID=66969 RepID=A0A0W0ZZZ1_9GAMM|nr:ABC transporter ATP-binding protein [Legionella waltersii]KTD74668.1 multidrug resistance ABC transporter ATP-binding protein (fused permease/ATPase domains) [Legionella waltersii]SNV09132.1 multidrug resistance ABC transporter ATP-binding protein (fused permease/ATPase domains) [Legionella waltersii]
MANSQQLPSTITQFIWYFIKESPWLYTLFFLAPVVMVLETNVIPYSLKMIVDGIVNHQGGRLTIFQSIAPALWLGGIAWFSFIIVLRLHNWWQAYLVPRFQAKIRMTVLSYLMQHSHHFFSNQMAGNLANKISDIPRSIEAIRKIISWSVITTIAAITVSMFFLLTINSWFAVILLTWISIQLLISLFAAKKINKLAKVNAEDKSQLKGKIVDTLNNINTVKLFAQNEYEKKYVMKSQLKEVHSNSRLIYFINVFRLFVDIPVSIMLVVMIYSVVSFWQRELITTGDLVFIFTTSFAIMTQMWNLSNSLCDLFIEVGIVKQALAILSIPIEVKDAEDAKELKVTQGEIRFDNVTFHHKEGLELFNNKSLVIPPKQKVGLVGYSGSGKTTFINLILRYFDVNAGRILIDNQDISKATQYSLRKSISMIPQDTHLFHRTLIENIKYGKEDANIEDIVAAADMANCIDFIQNLSQGFDTVVGERGTKLSGGQRQRIAIARAFLHHAPILVLDEATSQLDSLTEEYIQESLQSLCEGKTTIVVAHRLSTLLHMDRILVFDKGVIVEDGSHEELIARNGLYKSMWDAQTAGFLPEEVKEGILRNEFAQPYLPHFELAQ